MHTVIWILSGLLAGIVARIVTRSRGRGIVADTALGALGSVTGAWVLLAVFGQKPANSVGAHRDRGRRRDIARWRRSASLECWSARRNIWPGAQAAACFLVRAKSPGCRHSSAKSSSECSHECGRHVMPKRRFAPSCPLARASRTKSRRSAAAGRSWGSLPRSCSAGCSSTRRPTGRSDPYPFILLNLVLSCLAAAQAPVIMMSQNRASERDRFDARQDYEVNLRAELQIAELHQKLDQARASELQTLIELSKRQVALLEELARRP